MKISTWLTLAAPSIAALLAVGCGNDVNTNSGSAGSSSSSGSGGAGGAGVGGAGTGGEGVGGAGTGGGGTGGAGGVVSVSDVTGTIADTYMGPNGDVMVYKGIGASVSALVPDGKGAFSAIPGALAADGTFTIPSVPDATYYLEVKPAAMNGFPTYVVTTEHKLDLGRYMASRPNAQRVNMSPTNVTFDVTGLTAWQAADGLEFYSKGANLYEDVASIAMPPPAVGSTSLMGLVVDAAQLAGPGLVDQSKGDAAFLTQLVTKASGMITYRSVENVFAPAPFTLVNGMPTALAGAFSAVPQKMLALQWKRSLFAAMATEVHPTAAVDNNLVSVIAEGGGKERSTATFSPTLASAVDKGTTDATLDMTYGNPFPPAWAEVATGMASFLVKYTVPGLMTPKNIRSNVGVVSDPGTLMMAGVAPLLSPPKGLQVNGKAGDVDMTGVGLTPTLSWSPPGMGAAAAYFVSIRSIAAAGGAVKQATTIVTTGTSVVVPPGILASGNFYFVRVRAVTEHTSTTPNKLDNSYGLADALSGLLSP